MKEGKLDPSKQFDFSELYIFGKYENFVKRVTMIDELLNMINAYRQGCIFYDVDDVNHLKFCDLIAKPNSAPSGGAISRELIRSIRILTRLSPL